MATWDRDRRDHLALNAVFEVKVPHGLRRSIMAALLIGCEPLGSGFPQDTSTTDAEQIALVVSPGHIDFGTVSVLDQGTSDAEFLVENAGTSSVIVHGHDEVVAADRLSREAFTVVAEPIFELGPGEQQAFVVSFRPPTQGDFSAALEIDYGLQTLTLYGSGAAPVIALDGASGPPVPVGCEDDFQAEISNEGSEALQVTEAWFANGDDFSVVALPDEPALPGQSTRIRLRFNPQWNGFDDGMRTGELVIGTNDPYTPYASTIASALAYEGEKVTESFTWPPESCGECASGTEVAWTLREAPMVQSIAVEFDGIPTAAWSYRDTDNAVVFPDAGEVVPQTQIVLTYAIELGCEG